LVKSFLTSVLLFSSLSSEFQSSSVLVRGCWFKLMRLFYTRSSRSYSTRSPARVSGFTTSPVLFQIACTHLSAKCVSLLTSISYAISPADLQRMYSILFRVPKGLEPLRNKFKEHVKRQGEAAIEKIAGIADNVVSLKSFYIFEKVSSGSV